MSKELTIEDFLVNAIKVVMLLKKNIIFIGLTCLMFFGIALYMRPAKVFVAESTLMLKSSKNGGLLSVASQFGLGGGQEISFEEVVGISLSYSAISTTLLRQVEINGKHDLMINHLASMKNLKKEWEEKPYLRAIDHTAEGFLQDSIMLSMFKGVQNGVTLHENREKLIVLSCKFGNEQFSYLMNQLLLEYVMTYFEESETKSDIVTQKALQLKLDSLKLDLHRYEQHLASIADNSFHVVKRKGLVDRLRTEREVRILSEIYIELMKQLELVNFRIMDKKEPLQLVDKPIYPLLREQRGVVMLAALSGIAGFVVSTAFIFLFAFYNSTIKVLLAKERLKD
ncbi:MAG: hypothetical protein ACJA0Q_000795 [Saprospiraceae bacterium]